MKQTTSKSQTTPDCSRKQPGKRPAGNDDQTTPEKRACIAHNRRPESQTTAEWWLVPVNARTLAMLEAEHKCISEAHRKAAEEPGYPGYNLFGLECNLKYLEARRKYLEAERKATEEAAPAAEAERKTAPAP